MQGAPKPTGPPSENMHPPGPMGQHWQEGSGSGSEHTDWLQDSDEWASSVDGGGKPTPSPLPEYNASDICTPHPDNYNTCEQNIHCLHASEYDAEYCHSLTVPCRDCTGEGQICHNVRECRDELFFCSVLNDTQIASLNDTHPCKVEACNLKRNSIGCSKAVRE